MCLCVFVFAHGCCKFPHIQWLQWSDENEKALGYYDLGRKL